MSNRVFTVRGKIQKEQGKSASALETSVAQALYDIQVNPQAKDLGEVRPDVAPVFGAHLFSSALAHRLRAPIQALKPLFILSATQVDVPGGRAAIVVFIPYTLRTQFRAVQARLVRELEKKFGKTVVFIAQVMERHTLLRRGKG